ncbi:hypothetical protein H1D32_22720 [Anaerobacillus sp. CMMVII]|uniref:hypothetical protein n=1 Tax=Anaerobacillus sp. CMMVII TaxID=2755588 RepID=UPI0021B8465A|nr:hypothetical protein [Anaerobacillus sp. CMMVII]MCT8140265.1 hypothetical protein [Anaerobacillus sp. CMMVII]
MNKINKLKKGTKKFLIVFVPLGIITVILDNQGFWQISRFMPLLAIGIFWGWIIIDDKYRNQKQK